MPSLILVKPIFSEKAQKSAASGYYTFQVTKNSNKLQIKREVEKLFNVKVASVRTQNYKPKTQKHGRFLGKTSAFKKAIVKLDQGSIDLWAPPEKPENLKIKDKNDKPKSKIKK